MSALDKQVGGDHYRQGGIQPIQYIEANGLQFLEGSVVKRVTRHDQSGGKGRQDIEKAIHELHLLLELRYPQEERPAQPMKAGQLGSPPWGRNETAMTRCGSCLHVPCICGPAPNRLFPCQVCSCYPCECDEAL